MIVAVAVLVNMLFGDYRSPMVRFAQRHQHASSMKQIVFNMALHTR